MNVKNNYESPFPTRLRKLIEEKRTNQQAIADFVGVTRQAVAQWKDGKAIPDMYNFKKVAEFFGVPLEFLYGETDSKVQENMLLADTLGLSDKAIEEIGFLKSKPYLHPNDNEYATKSEIFSAIIEGEEFWGMIEYLQRAIREYKNYQRAVEKEYGAIPDVFGLEIEEKKLAADVGKSIIDADKMSVFCVYQTVDLFKKIIEDLPENFWLESVGLK